MRILLGVVSEESRVAQRNVLRDLYAKNSLEWNVTVHFVMDVARASAAIDAASPDVRLVRVLGKRSHCIHKTLGWLRLALLEDTNAKYLLKTDDDAYVRIDRIAQVLLRPMESTHIYGGVVGYTSFAPTEWRGSCYGYGMHRAIKLHRDVCHKDVGPMPFAIGPLIILSHATAAWLLKRIPIVPRQTCKNEDRMIGYATSHIPRLSLLSLGEHGVSNGNGATFVTHHVRDGNFLERQFTSSARLRPACVAWKTQTKLLTKLTCCHNWTLCQLS